MLSAFNNGKREKGGGQGGNVKRKRKSEWAEIEEEREMAVNRK